MRPEVRKLSIGLTMELPVVVARHYFDKRWVVVLELRNDVNDVVADR